MDSDVREFNQAAADRAQRQTVDALARDGEAINAARSAPVVPAELDSWIDENGDVAALWHFGDALDETKIMG